MGWFCLFCFCLFFSWPNPQELEWPTHACTLRPGTDFLGLCLSQTDPMKEDFPAGKERAFVDLACLMTLHFSNMEIMVYDAKLYIPKPTKDVCSLDFYQL